MKSNDLSRLKNELQIINCLISILNFLAERSYPILITISHIQDSTSLVQNSNSPQFLKRFYLMIRYENISEFLSIQSILYQNLSPKLKFFRRLIDYSFDYRKSDTFYFPPLIEEPELFEFFDSAQSPLSKKGLIPIKIDASNQSVVKWLKESLEVLTNFDHIFTDDRKDSISIFLCRYLFERKYEILQPHFNLNVPFHEKMSSLSTKLPTEMDIPLVYLPPEFSDQPLSNYFDSNSISKAPIEWLNLAQFQYCPIDIAYYILKAHESLTVLAGLTASNNKENEFFKRIPGFDDIFGFWVSALCCSIMVAPDALSEFLGNWSNLPGMPNRLKMPISYLNAVTTHISSLLEN